MIPEATDIIDVNDGSLTDWDKHKTLLQEFAAEPPYVPFADVYLAWNAWDYTSLLSVWTT